MPILDRQIAPDGCADAPEFGRQDNHDPRKHPHDVAPKKSLEECEGICLVETGKNIAADNAEDSDNIANLDNSAEATSETYKVVHSFNLVLPIETRDDLWGAFLGAEIINDRFGLMAGINVLLGMSVAF